MALHLATKLVLAPVLVAQALATRRRAPVLPEAAGERVGRHGEGGAAPLRLLVVGDSSGAGVGVETQDRAFVGQLVPRLAVALGRPVQWQLVAKSGITSAGALALLREAKPAPADVAVAVLGVNDVIEQVPVRRAIAHRDALARWLQEQAGVRHVAFTALPPVHQFPLLPRPLRWVMGADARRHDEALARWAARRHGVSHVPVVLTLDAAAMASDGFHPGEPVYRACGEAVAAHLAARADLIIPKETPP